jgi:hypothetical protein
LGFHPNAAAPQAGESLTNAMTPPLLLLVTLGVELLVATLVLTTWNRKHPSSSSLRGVLLVCAGLNLISHSSALAIMITFGWHIAALESGILAFEAVGYGWLTDLGWSRSLLLALFTNGVTILLMLV